MTAEEMFDKLGFKLLTKINEEIPRKNWNYKEDTMTYYDGHIIIIFDLYFTGYRTIEFKNDDDDDKIHFISVALHQAITQQMKELG